MPAVHLHDLTRLALGERLREWGYGAFYRDRLFEGLYRQLATHLAAVDGLRSDLLERVNAELPFDSLAVHREVVSDDQSTRKYLLQLADGKMVETVLMRFRGRSTVCLSTQAGCAMGCRFCATGQMGFERHLRPGEIAGQVVHVARVLAQTGERLRNIVLMGMGEPLHNYDSVMEAVDIVTDHRGLAIGPRFITLSTVGVVPGIRRLANDARPIQLAVSLHGSSDAERNALVPVGRQWPLAELLDACREYAHKRRAKVFFEWALIEGRNDSPDQAHALGKLLSGLDAHLNVIPLNPTQGYDGQPSDNGRMQTFRAVLFSYGIPSTVRQRRGIDIDAGCGQLKSKVLGDRPTRSRTVGATATPPPLTPPE